MPTTKPNRRATTRKMKQQLTVTTAALVAQRLTETIAALKDLKLPPEQQNDNAAYTLLALLNLQPDAAWTDAQAPLLGIKGINSFIASAYGHTYAENSRESIRKKAVNPFVAEGLVLKNPDNPNRSTNDQRTVYKIEPTALALFHKVGTPEWAPSLQQYLASREALKNEIDRKRNLARVPVTLSDGSKVSLSPGGQNPLIKAIIEDFCPVFAPRSLILYIGDTESKFAYLDKAGLAALGVTLDPATKIPDVIVHHADKNWLLLIEAVTSAGPVDSRRRMELKNLFACCKAGLVFVTAFGTRHIMRRFLLQIAWESEVWIAEDPDHMIHFNGERFLGPYSDVMPSEQ